MTANETGKAELLSQRICNELTDAIASGDLPAGAALDEQVLAGRYGVSRTPVREALRQLAVGGLIELRPRRGAIVARLTTERIMQMFEATAEIEALCARLATQRMTMLERIDLMRILEASDAAVEAGDVDRYDTLNRDFHDGIYRATHNAFLAEQAVALRERLGTFRRMQLRDVGRLAHSRREHEDVMRAMLRGDGEAAERGMRAHMLTASRALEHMLPHSNALTAEAARPLAGASSTALHGTHPSSPLSRA